MPSYEQNKNSKLWSVRFREPDENGIEHQRRLSGFKTKKEAQYGYQDYVAAKAEEAKKKAAQTPETPDDMLFETLTELFFNYKEGRVKYSTYYSMRSRVNAKLIPYFKGMKMKDIKPITILDWQKKTFAGMSYATTSKLMEALGAIYRYGEKYHDVTNIMHKVDKPRNLSPKKEMLFWTPEEFNKFYEAAENETYKLFFLTLYTMGLRRGECEALMWNDVNFSKSTLKVSKSITNKTQKTGWEITTPKNAGSNRIVTMPAFLRDMLKEYKKQKTEFTEDTDFVFGGSRPLAPTSTDRYFKNTIEKAGIKQIRIHDLRHSCASLLISKGVSIVGVSHHLGHTDVEQTLNTYSHLMPDDKQRIATELQNVGKLITKHQ
ncbi:MAG: site-specific integrase [Ruminococcaceae bacterium]|nr:site-specific integrase [Oscillospiraceae bacterium]